MIMLWLVMTEDCYGADHCLGYHRDSDPCYRAVGVCRDGLSISLLEVIQDKLINLMQANRFPSNQLTSYQELRPQLMPGDVLICSGTGIFSTMIQRATGSVWSHVGFILRLDAIDRVMLLESVEPIGVRTVRLSKYLTDYKDGKPYPGGIAVIRNRDFEKKAKKSGLATLAKYAVDQFGYPYDKEDIARIAARILASKVPFSVKERERIEPNREYICSEYVGRCYETIGLKVKWDKRGFVAPADFARDERFELVGVLRVR